MLNFPVVLDKAHHLRYELHKVLSKHNQDQLWYFLFFLASFDENIEIFCYNVTDNT